MCFLQPLQPPLYLSPPALLALLLLALIPPDPLQPPADPPRYVPFPVSFLPRPAASFIPLSSAFLLYRNGSRRAGRFRRPEVPLSPFRPAVIESPHFFLPLRHRLYRRRVSNPFRSTMKHRSFREFILRAGSEDGGASGGFTADYPRSTEKEGKT